MNKLAHRTLAVSNELDRPVAILLALHNGAANLAAQLDSFAEQGHANWSLVISDDGPDDGARAIVERFAAANSDRGIAVIEGPKRGFALNFVSMIAGTPEGTPFAALSDQDDVWKPGKLERALSKLDRVPEDVPGLYVGRTVICDEALSPLRLSPEFTRPPDFRNALVQSIGGGNTMVLNRAAIDLVRRVAPRIDRLVAHDWWLYQMITGTGGEVIYDTEPMVFYRQHGANLIGANDNPGAAIARLKRIMRGHFSAWMDVNLEVLEKLSDHLTTESRQTLEAVRAMRRGSFLVRPVRLRRSGLHRQSARDDAALYVSALLGKL